MNELYILRHGIAVEPGTPGIPDDERPLTPKGEKRMREIARGLRRLDLKLDRIVTSPLPRARATAEIVADALDARDLLETADILQAGTAAATIQRWLRRADRGAADDRRPQPGPVRPDRAPGPRIVTAADLRAEERRDRRTQSNVRNPGPLRAHLDRDASPDSPFGGGES